MYLSVQAWTEEVKHFKRTFYISDVNFKHS